MLQLCRKLDGSKSKFCWSSKKERNNEHGFEHFVEDNVSGTMKKMLKKKRKRWLANEGKINLCSMKMQIICSYRIHFNFQLKTRKWTHTTTTPHSTINHQISHSGRAKMAKGKKTHTFNTSKLCTYWISFENLNIWLLLPVWEIEQFGWAHVLWSDFEPLKTTGWKVCMHKEKNYEMRKKVFDFCTKRHFHIQDIATYIFVYFPPNCAFQIRILVLLPYFFNSFCTDASIQPES